VKNIFLLGDRDANSVTHRELDAAIRHSSGISKVNDCSMSYVLPNQISTDHVPGSTSN